MKKKNSKKKNVRSELPSIDNPELLFESSVTRSLVGVITDETPRKRKGKNQPEEEYGGILSSSFSSKDF